MRREFNMGNKNKNKNKNKKQNTIGFKTHSYAKTVKKTTPKDTYANDKMAIVFFDQSVLNGMKDKCLDTAGGSEWQIHHADLRVELERSGITVSLFFPAAFYNFDQDVGPSSVDWETADADKAYNDSKEAALENAQKLIKEMPIFAALEEAGMNIKYDFGDFGSIHRHPGRFGFSSVDTRKDPDNPGVIYRRHEAENLWQVDSVMYMSDKKSDVEIYTTECRILNIKEAKDGGVEGEYCKIPTITMIRDDRNTETHKDGLTYIFGDIKSSVLDEYTIVGSIKPYPLLETILTMFKNAEYACNTDNVVADRITQKTYGYQKKNGLWGRNGYHGYGYDYYGYGSYYDNDAVIPKSNTRFDLEEEIMELCPFKMTEAESDYFKNLLKDITYIELRELCKVAYSLSPEKQDALFEVNEKGRDVRKDPTDPFMYDDEYYYLYDY
jgi:hypothetical protein